mgnify:FL=1
MTMGFHRKKFYFLGPLDLPSDGPRTSYIRNGTSKNWNMTLNKAKKSAKAEKKNAIGERVRELREKLGIYQAEVADRMRSRGHQVGRVQVNKIEGGTRFVSDMELLTLAEIFQVTPHTLLGFEPPRKK